MSESPDEPGIQDQDLPEDLRPGEENPLAEGLSEEQLREDDGPDRDDLDLTGGRRPEQSEEDDDGASGEDGGSD